MATTTGTKATSDADTAGAAAGTAAADPPGAWPQPIVYEYRKRRGKKRYSKGTKDIQVCERGFSRSLERVADAVADGFGRYRRRRNRSANRKKDGAIKDFVRNVGRGAEKALRTGSKAPTDLTRRVTWKRLRRATRSVIPPVPFFVRW
ncbi:MAG TPA: hypothetical protein VFS60_12120 [Thermoanaerobaculia bacterium]|nr:hypothetical protein [Thermoanaerobaculia bacterium]